MVQTIKNDKPDTDSKTLFLILNYKLFLLMITSNTICMSEDLLCSVLQKQ